MKAIVLAAGAGKRLKPLTAKIPKPLLPAGGKPIIMHILEYLKKNGIEEVGIVVHAYETLFHEVCKDVTLIRQDKPIGTGDAVKSARNFCNEEFLCINGDIVFEENMLKEVIEKGKSGKNVVCGVEGAGRGEYGVIECEGENVVKIHEKAKFNGNLINAGIYFFTPEIFTALDQIKLSPRNEYELTDAINYLATMGKVVCAKTQGMWLDIGKPWELLRANEWLLQKITRKIEGEVEEFAVVKGNVVIGEGTVVLSGSYIVGPVYIGRNCRIGPNAYIRPSTYIGDNVHIGNASEIKNSIIMSNSNAPHLNYVGDSVIGFRVNLGAGTKIANLRLDGREIHSYVQGEKVPTHLRKFGAVIGDDTKVGINCSINPGAVICEDCKIGAGKQIESKYYAAGTRIL
ncbi:MAG: bifunctional sugar-1-phosphate nucleotidylyltransferase/acetyltransferase [Thermoplasmata archaeon]